MAANRDNEHIRPSRHEINSKVRDALAAIEQGRRVLGVTKHLIDDFTALEIGCVSELWETLATLFREILAAQPHSCYVGGHPPVASYDDEMKGLELWPYRWQSPSQGKLMFVKFALKRNRQGQWIYVHVDVHEDRSKGNAL